MGRLQAGLNWTAFDTIVTGWSMDKPMERVRVLGTSPETDVTEVRSVLGQYGEIVEAQKGLISRKLPGCTNGIWTVKMFLKEGKSLPPFLIMKDEGEVWQLATGEASVCWKCGGTGHIGDKCRQAVNILAESLASTAVGVQPSWAHVVKGGISVVPPAPPPPVLPPFRPQTQSITINISSEILKMAKSTLKPVLEVVKNSVVVGKVVNAPVEPVFKPVGTVKDVAEKEYALPGSPALQSMEVVDAFHHSEDEKSDDASRSSLAGNSALKRVKLSQAAMDSSASPGLSSSPDLRHKVPGGSRQEQQQEDGVSAEGGGMHTNMFGINDVMWFVFEH